MRFRVQFSFSFFLKQAPCGRKEEPAEEPGVSGEESDGSGEESDGSGEESDRRFTLQELRDVLQEKNQLKAQVFTLEEELAYYKRSHNVNTHQASLVLF